MKTLKDKILLESKNSVSELVKNWCKENEENLAYKTEKEVEEIFVELQAIFMGCWDNIGKQLLERCENDKMQNLAKTKKSKRTKMLKDYFEFLAKYFS
jgi:hypothetical protein